MRLGSRIVVALAAALSLAGLLGSTAAIARDGPAAKQEVVFFPSVASVADGKQWLLTLQGRVHTPAKHSAVRQKLIDVLALRLHADKNDQLYRERAAYFVSDSSRNTRVSVTLGNRVIALSPSNAAGYFSTDIVLSDAEATQLAQDGMIAFASMPTAANPQRFDGAVRLVPETGVTVITDIDDTIKVTHILDAKEKEANTFMRPFVAVPGMAELYRSWQQALGDRVHFHVVSAGPWQFNEPLRQFFAQAGFPAFTWDMRSIDIGGNIVVDLREASPAPQKIQDFKVAKIRAFMARFPQRSVVLVGDSGERDPEVYAAILAAFPQRVQAVYLRDVTNQDHKHERYQRLFPGDAAQKLQVFRDPAALPPLSSIAGGNLVR
jgi:phosphatidate phosphatase APP1